MTRNMPVGMHIYVKLKGNKTAKFTVLKRLQGKKNEALSATQFTALESVPDGVHTGDATKENELWDPKEKPVKRSP